LNTTHNPAWLSLMRCALNEARMAFSENEVPVGAAIANKDGHIIASAHNRTISFNDPCAHAEIIAIRQAASACKNYRLNNTTIAVTIEPCPMCMGAIITARINRLLFGAFDPKTGAAGSIYDFASNPALNHRVNVVSGIMEMECRTIIQDFFKLRRQKKKPNTVLYPSRAEFSNTVRFSVHK